MMIDDSYFMDYIKQLGKGPGSNNKTRQYKKAGPRRLALAQPQKRKGQKRTKIKTKKVSFTSKK